MPFPILCLSGFVSLPVPFRFSSGPSSLSAWRATPVPDARTPIGVRSTF